MSTTERGRQGEEIAAYALKAHGYEIVERNWRCPAGEIDLVARDGEVVVFVEVKLRGSGAFGSPEEAVNEAKRARLLQAGAVYLAEHGLDDVPCRIDVVAIELAPSGKVQRLSIHRDAVRAHG